MKAEQTLEEKLGNRITICPECGARKTVSWAPCDICGVLATRAFATRAKSVVTEFPEEPGFMVKLSFSI